MESQRVSNWLKLHLLLDQAQASLQDIFLRSWKAKFGREWDLNSSAIILDSKQFQVISAEQRKVIQEAEVYTWDLTILNAVLTAKNLLCLPTDQVDRITQIASIRNKIVHFPNKLIPENQFNELWNELQQILVNFGVPDSDLHQLKQHRQLGGVEFMPIEDDVDEANCTEAAKLKEKGNEQFKKGDYLAAIQLFSEGINLPGIRDVDRATIYSNRCAARLKLHKTKQDNDLLHKGEDDAKKAIELRPEWWRGHFRLGEIYAAAEKYKKAEWSFNEALAREPHSQAIIDSLSEVRWHHGQHSRMDYLDAGHVAKSSTELFRGLEEKTGLTLDVEKVMKLVSSKSDNLHLENIRNCLLGYQYRHGVDGFPRDAQLAAKHYKIAADNGYAVGMYNLASMLLNGEGMKKEFTTAVSVLRKAAAQTPILPNGLVNCGVAEAEHELGLCYESGIGVNKNTLEAMKWYTRSSEHGCPNAANNLGLMYQHGVLNLQPDSMKAEQLFKLAAKSRGSAKPNCNAMLNLALLYESRGDCERALKWCCRAKEYGSIHLELDQLTARLNESIQQFADSGVVDWENHNNKSSDGLTLYERQERFLTAITPEFSAVTESLKLLADKLHKYRPANLLKKTKFEADELEKCAAYSVYGRKLWKGKLHFSAAMYVMLNEIKDIENLSLDVCAVFIEHLSAAAKIEIIVMEFQMSWYDQALSVVTRLLKRRTTFDQDVRVCYAALQSLYFTEFTIQFVNGCLELYPKVGFFLECRACMYAFLNRYEDGIRDINLGIKLQPNSYELLYYRAAMLKQLVPTVSARAAIDAYKQFLAHAPEDHRKFPEAYYSIAVLEEDLDELNRNYELGLSAEKKQLSFFLPYKSTSKIMTECKMAVSAESGLKSRKKSPATSKFQSLIDKPNVVEPKNADVGLKLSDPNRIALIKHHRLLTSQFRKLLSSEQFASIKVTHPPPKEQTMPQSLFGLKAISLEEMDPNKDHVYKGHVLRVTIIDEPGCTGSSIAVVLEDTNGDVERCCIYNSPHMEKYSKTREIFGPGCKMSIINPYYRMATDGMSLIRVDDPSTLIVEDCVPNMCRYCTKPEATLRCARCKNAFYCGKTCQTLDWKILTHKLICIGDRQQIGHVKAVPT